MSASAPPEIPGLVYVQPVGSGGYADVYLYQQQMPRMPVAVKVLKGEGLTPSLRRQFSDEADTMAQLADHPYIVQVFRSDTAADGRPYLVMKYFPPPNLAMRARSERFNVEEVLRTGIQLASAVETAHRAGIIHRDIKPANVLVSQYGTPGLTDFGIAGRGAAAEEDDDVGVSVPWAAPEVLFGQSAGDARADVYSLAATLWQLLVGRSPFEVPGGDNTAYGLMPRIRSNQVPSTGRADVPPSLERLLAQAMSKDPASRPATAVELARGLQAIEQEQRFGATRIVVLDEQGHSTLADQNASALADDVDATRVRAPQAVQAQAPAAPPQAWAAPPLSGGTSIPPVATPPSGALWGPSSAQTPNPNYSNPNYTNPNYTSAGSGTGAAAASASAGDLADEGTIRVNRRKAREAEGDAGQAAPGPTSASGKGGLLVVAAAVVLALVVGLAYLAFRPDGGTTDAGDDPTSEPVITQSVGGDDGPVVELLVAPTVNATSVAGKVSFAWTYPDRDKGDTYRVAFGVDPSNIDRQKYQAATATNFTVPTAKGAQICAQVQVLRSGSASEWSKVACERAG